MSTDFPNQALLDWFSKNQRDFPWRKNYDAYSVWICEVMAQQTRMDQLLPYYEHFLKKFPNVHALANAPYADVLKSWEGLGYYSRAKNLHIAAKQIVKEHDGKIPPNKAELLELSGFGPYIASAVASIAFEQDVVVVDGNVLRVMARFWGDKSDIRENNTKKKFEEQLQKILPIGKARYFNQAIMELGALVCVPDKPLCANCPLQSNCKAFANNAQDSLPVKSPKKKPAQKHFALAVIENDSKLLVSQRSEKLLSDMWELPLIEYQPLMDSKKEIEKKLTQKLGATIQLGTEVGTVHHQYTHLTQFVHVFSAQLMEKYPPVGFEWCTQKQLSARALPKVQHKVLELIGSKKE